MARRVFITVAEVSGDQHAAQLVQSLRELEPDISIEGLGGPLMRQAGAVIHQETTGRAAMSWRAVMRIFEISRLLKWTKRYFDADPPDLQICVDSFAMNVYFAKLAHQRGIPVLYYIPPQLWASREGRMEKLQRWVDHVACILPFEEQYLRGHGIAATFVGHPLFDELPAERHVNLEGKFPNRPPVVGLIPGSRRTEAVQNFPHLLDVAARIRKAFADVSFLVPTMPSTHPVVERLLKRLAGKDPGLASAVRYELDGFDKFVPQCDLCITKSGTSTLHVAGYGVPMIVVYRGSRVLWHAIGRWLIKTRTYSLVNLLSDSPKHIVPEFIPWYGSNGPVASKAIDFLEHPEKLQEQRDRLRELIDRLDHPGASMNVARLAFKLMNERPVTWPGHAHSSAGEQPAV